MNYRTHKAQSYVISDTDRKIREGYKILEQRIFNIDKTGVSVVRMPKQTLAK
jgi:hypothetical protein